VISAAGLAIAVAVAGTRTAAFAAPAAAARDGAALLRLVPLDPSLLRRGLTLAAALAHLPTTGRLFTRRALRLDLR
jgi:hypothetical protein